jgi:hypothetical protein
MVVGLITDDDETAYREGGKRPGSVVPGQEPIPQCEKDKITNHELQGKED